MRGFLINPDVYFHLCDLAIALIIYGISIALFLKYKRDYMTPVLFLGLFIFPLQFSIWFLQPKITLNLPSQFHILEIFYLLFVKTSILMALIFLRR